MQSLRASWPTWRRASGDLAAVLDDFVAKGLISEERLTQSVLNQRANKLGAMRLRAELHQKGVSTDRIREAVDSLKSSESARAQGVWSKRFKGATRRRQGHG